MKIPTIKERFLLHLYEYRNYRNEMIVPYELCVAGISKILNLKQNVIRMEISQMKKRGENLIEEDIKHVRGLAKKRKVYFLTPRGYERAKEIREGIMNMNTKIILDDGKIVDIKLREIEKYIPNRNSLIIAINKMDENGIIDFNRKEKKKDIFTGRERELNYLRDVIKELEKGSKIILVRGEAGIGKTRLIFEMRKEIMKKGYEFFWGKAYFDSSEPYLPFKEIFENYLNTGKDENIKLLVNMANSSFYKDSGMRVEDRRSFESQRNSMWWEISERIKDIATIRPLIIFIDDLQWADKATLQFLLYLGDHLRNSPVLLIGTIREGENNEYLEDVLERMSRMQLYEELKLKGLKWRDAKEIIENIVGRKDVPNRFIDLIYRRTMGNPLFIREIIREMLEEGKIEREKGEYPKEGELKIPEMIEQLVQRRVKLVDTTGKKLLEVGSVIGENIPYNLLLSAAGMEEFELLDHVDNLINLGLWYEEPDEEKLSFSHGLIQLAVYENIPRIKRKKLHLMIAEKMEEIYKDNLNKYYSELAYHYERGGNYKNAVEYYMKAGEEAEKIYAHDVAIDFYERVLKLNTDKEKKFKIYNKLGEIYGIIGEYEKAEGYYRKVLEMVEGEEKAEIKMKIGDLYEKKGEYEMAMRNYKDALNSLSENSALYPRIYNSISWIEKRRGNYESSIEYAKKAIEISDGDKDRARVYHNMGTVYLDMGEYEFALKFLNKAVEIHKKIEDLRGLGASYNNIGLIFTQMGNMNEALKYYEKSLNVMKKVGDIYAVGNIYNNIGAIYYYRGNLNKALEYYEKSLETQEKIGDKYGISLSLMNIGEVYLERGEIKKALEFFRKSLNISEDMGNKYTSADGYNNIGGAYLELGDTDKSIEYAYKSLKIATEIGSNYLLINNYVLLSKIHTHRGNFEKGVEFGEKALYLAREINSTMCIMDSYRVIGMAYGEKGEYEKGEEYLKKAMNISEELGIRGEHAKNLYELGILYKKKGDEKWKETIEKAKTIFEECGILLYVNKINKIFQECDNHYPK